MINRQALIVVLAAAAAVQNTHAFVPSSSYSIQQCQIRTTSLHEAISKEEDVDLTRQVIMNSIDTPSAEDAVDEQPTPIVDAPPMPIAAEPVAVAAPTPVAAKAAAPKKKMQSSHKDGVFSPIVVAGKVVLGKDSLIKLRAKIIGLHSDLIKDFVATSDSETGKAVLRQLFKIVDTDDSGYLDKAEVAVALNTLGFSWLGDKQVDKIFERADANGDEEISLEEFMQETPKTLKMNLIKLAKQNGGDMGLLV